ncbi:hypothetical protein SAMN05192555_10353 [Franzmannia pantelleriensis]|uniref:Uncharacterized protein n=1 Tax=Franzmannia pantelleriensis TaxID=48727 RepID=A0A1G9I3F0_9GAMM|nr:hypothetical protein SAMN05192555_10353 [Halomonas pantelleriensis]
MAWRSSGVPRRIAKALLLVLMGLWLLYLALANTLINSERLRAALLDEPLARTELDLRWERAWSWYPGQLSAARLELVQQAPRWLGLDVEQVNLRVALWPLLGGRIEIDHLDASRIHEVAVGRLRVAGSGRLRLSELAWQQRELSIQSMALDLDNGSITRDAVTLVEDIRLAARLRLVPFDFADQRGGDIVHAVDGELDLAGASDAYAVFSDYLLGLEWLEVSGHGDLTGRLLLEAGELLPGSELQLDSPDLGVTLDSTRLTPGGQRYQLLGDGRIRATISDDQGEPETRLDLTLDDMHMWQQDGTEVMRGDGFRIALAGERLRLDQPPERLHRAGLRWEDTELTNIATLAPYLPAAIPLQLEGGRARLRGFLDYRDDTLEGTFRLDGDEVALRLGDTPMQGRLGVTLALPLLDPRSGRLHLSGTHLTLAATGDDAGEPLTTSLVFPRAELASAWPLLPLEPFLTDDEQPDTPVVTSPLLASAPFDAALSVSGEIDNLSVLDGLLGELFVDQSLGLRGGGRLSAEFDIQQGRPLPGSRLQIDSEEIGGQFLGLDTLGQGTLTASLVDDTPQRGLLTLDLSEVGVRRLSDGRRLFDAPRLSLSATGELPDSGRRLDNPEAQLAWQAAEVPDVTALNLYLPESPAWQLDGGTAGTSGVLVVDSDSARGRITLDGSAIRGQLLGQPLSGGADLELIINQARFDSGRLDISGSRLALQASAEDAETRSVVVAREAVLTGGSGWQQGGARTPSGRLRLDGLLADMALFNALLSSEHGLAVDGSAQLRADIELDAGRLVPGSELRLDATPFSLGFLDLEARGDGQLVATATGSREALSAALMLRMPQVDLRRDDADGALIEGRHMQLTAEARQLDLDAGLQALDTHIALPHIEAPDLAVFNAYLPEDSPLRLLGGHVTLASDLRLDGYQAHGMLRLDAPDARLAFNEHELSGSLMIDARLNDGDLRNMTFDSSGSRISLSNVQLAEDNAAISDGWWADLELAEGRLTWQQPLSLDSELRLAMRDSGPLVELFVSAARERRWLRNLLTVRDIRGQARLEMQQDRLDIRHLVLSGQGRELRANLRLGEASPRGVFYARYGALSLGVALADGQRRWQWPGARGWFERQPVFSSDHVSSRHWLESLEVDPP